MLTPTDLRQVAASIGIEVVGADDAVSATAQHLTEAMNTYVLSRRMESANSGPSEVEEWAAKLLRWSDEGLVLLGGTVEENEISREFPTLHGRSTMHLADACPFEDAKKTELMLSLAGQETGSYELVQRTATALQLLQYLAPMLIERVRRLRQTGRPVEWDRRLLFQALEKLFRSIHAEPWAPHRVKDVHRGPREDWDAGPALDWVRAIFRHAAERAAISELSNIATDLAALSDWAERPDAAGALMRPKRGKCRE